MNVESGWLRPSVPILPKEGIVAIEINSRLSTLAFLSISGTGIKGNFGIGDQVTALRWVKQYMAAFGGDPDRITIIGENAGAGSARALLGSPSAINENLIVGAVVQSYLGGRVSLGLKSKYGTTYSSSYNFNQSYVVDGQQIFTAVGCNQTYIVSGKTGTAKVLVSRARTEIFLDLEQYAWLNYTISFYVDGRSWRVLDTSGLAAWMTDRPQLLLNVDAK